MRCFVAIGLDDAVRSRIEAAVARLRAAIEGSAGEEANARRISWTRSSGWHVTLKFLGEVAEERIARIGAALSAAVSGFGRFDMMLAGLHGFPADREPRALVVGVDDAGRCAALATRVDTALQALGFSRETRPHAAHLTLARLRDRAAARKARAIVEAQGREAFGTVSVDCVELYESLLGPQRAHYRELMRFALSSEAS